MIVFRLIIPGEPLHWTSIKIMLNHIADSCCLWNLYKSAETTYHLINPTREQDLVSIGCPLPNYRCLVLDTFLQHVIINQPGELFVCGVSVFDGYLGRDDLTDTALVEINGKMFYRTGDLVRIDNNSLLHFIGGRDYQIKLHGQRIEIERCLLTISSISACIVMKWDDDHLVIYVQSLHVDEQQLREYCQFHLPSHMIPSVFIALDKLPLTTNGKIDRALLTSLHFSSSIRLNRAHLPSLTPLEQCLCDIFRKAFHNEFLDGNMTFFPNGWIIT